MFNAGEILPLPLFHLCLQDMDETHPGEMILTCNAQFYFFMP